MFSYYPLYYGGRSDTHNQQINYQNSLFLINQSVQGEKNDELFYDELIRMAPTVDQQNIIISIRDDERKHNVMFRDIYRSLTGREVTGISNEEFIKPSSYLEGIQKALFGELSAVEKYREIWKGLPVGPYRDALFEIILDELKHSSKYNYLFTLNSVLSK
ncbi:ferritin-like domain-containing protein [Paenibacillus segetis]|uniref:Rubrerythrin n=1 Tax=Paenibacillus segetis TaxID=1325360 RepID=A0ABQ1Y8X8_9BACL|nr:ferritin-like domain-containing protein [Paenibacillus segetis]GGH16633.1 hypothetical protein GCM10008013_11510 [Paenibacillus segetis]